MDFLRGILPAKARGYVYAFALLLLLAVTSWQAHEGDWDAAAVAFLGALVSALARENVTQDIGQPAANSAQAGNTPAVEATGGLIAERAYPSDSNDASVRYGFRQQVR